MEASILYCSENRRLRKQSIRISRKSQKGYNGPLHLKQKTNLHNAKHLKIFTFLAELVMHGVI